MTVARRAGPSDLPFIKAATAAAYETYISDFGARPPPMDQDYTPQVLAGETWIAADGGIELGLMVLEARLNTLVILNLVVLPAAQGRGTGRWLLAFAEGRARVLGLHDMQLFTNARMTRNIGIYERFGYVETGRRPNPSRAGWILVDMAKPVG